MPYEPLILEWNGSETPEVLRELPPGRYLLQPVDDEPNLTPEQERGLMEAMDALDRGEGRPLEEVLERLRAPLRVREQ